ncbi:Flp pilus assembly complex ATPase component TadA [bacterium]|nr:Flp pilus assembly complex ATPase component TadA [bacterium]
MYKNLNAKILEFLLENKYVDKKAYTKAIGSEKIKSNGFYFFGNLVSEKLIDEKKLYEAYSAYFKIPLANINELEPSVELSNIIPPKDAQIFNLVPLKMAKDESLLVAIANPFDTAGKDTVNFIANRPATYKLATLSDVKKAIEFLYNTDNYIQGLVQRTSNKHSNIKYENFDRGKIIESVAEEKTLQAPIVKLLNIIIIDAFAHRASDIHIEPQDNKVLIRYRIDGELIAKMDFPELIGPPLISRIKVLSELDLANHFSPQDGKIHVKIDGKPLDLRISVLPMIWGEKVVIRLLDGKTMFSSLENLGFTGETLERFLNTIRRPQGIILVTGPTGSGKSTTLYGAIEYLKSEDKNINITTIEDPVEYEIEGVNQVQVNPKRGITFASSLRSVLRQDPDVILVGEIRDPETAKIAVQAAQTGHLVFSTLHTNDSVGAISRLKELGTDVSVIKEVTLCILAQRLIKKICPYCKRDAKKSELPEYLVKTARKYNPNIRFSIGEGCSHCDWTGFLGRTAAIELLVLNTRVKDTMATGSENKVRAEAIDSGMQPMNLTALELIDKGITELKSTARSVYLLNEKHQDNSESNEVSHGITSTNKKQSEKQLESRDNLVSDENDQENKPINRDTSVDDLLPFLDVLLCGLEEKIVNKVEKHLIKKRLNTIALSNPNSIIEFLHKQKPALIVIDKTVDSNAVDFLEEIRSHLCFIDLPLLLITDKTPQETDEIPFCLGADDYLIPPYDFDVLIQRIDSLARKNINQA